MDTNRPYKCVVASAQLIVLSAVAFAALGMSATASSQPAEKAQPEPTAIAALMQQTRQEPYKQPQPNHHRNAYSDKPVAAKLGPNTFMFPMNLYQNQMGPDFQGEVALTILWPGLEALSPGERGRSDYSDKYASHIVDISPDFIDKLTLQELMLNHINEGNGKYAWSVPDDPTQHRDLRIKGGSLYGLVPYYTDRTKLENYFRQRGYPTDKENIDRHSDDWYLSFDDKGIPVTKITCTTRSVPGAFLKDGVLVDTKAGKNRGACTHIFTLEKYKLVISVRYLRAYLQDWRRIEDRIGRIFDQYYLADKPN
jgi:hypothetical protein